jgi:hypothetical protein
MMKAYAVVDNNGDTLDSIRVSINLDNQMVYFAHDNRACLSVSDFMEVYTIASEMPVEPSFGLWKYRYDPIAMVSESASYYDGMEPYELW